MSQPNAGEPHAATPSLSSPASLMAGIQAALLVLAAAVCITPAWAEPRSYQLPGGAADYADPYVAAGFRALFTCSAHFLMGRTRNDILDVELRDTQELDLPAPVIDSERRLVRASDGRGATAIAAFRDTMGCTLLPPHWSQTDVPRLPYVARDLPRHDPQLAFPLGDRAAPQPTRRQEALVAQAFDGESFGDGTLTTAVIVVREGNIVAERYREGFGVRQGYRTWSTAKSISATLIGIAAGQSLLRLDEPAPVPEWQGPADPRRHIQLDHLLWMSSGLWSRGSNSYASYFAGQDVLSAATTTHLEAPPGSRWKYANNDTLLALRALRHALADDLAYLRFPYDELFHRIGMFDTWMETDHLGNFIGSSQVYTTARDLARFALLYLNDGIWNGERILPEGWVEYVAAPAPARAVVSGERGYGAQFWLLGGVDGLPPDAYTTSGNKGQYATILPSHDLVVVRTGVDPLGRRWQQPRFVAEVLDAFAD